MKKILLSIIFFICLSHNVLADEIKQSSCTRSYADMVEPLLPSVVNITVSQKAVQNNRNEFPAFPPGSPFEDFNRFFEKFGMAPPSMDEDHGSDNRDELKLVSAGSGFIIDSEGYIVTNHHVIADAEKISVITHGDQKFDAKLIGSDSRTDIALIKINSKTKLPYVKFGDADKIRVGDSIVAIGNPFGLGGTVTAGIVSARSRDIHAGAVSLVDNFIQTDAAINKGNSGGPLFNLNGEVIGINAAIYSPSGGNVGIGFAVPSSVAVPVIDQIKKNGKVLRGWLGVTIQQTEGITEGIGVTDNKGALVVSIEKNSPSEKYGLSVGDVITKFDGKEISSTKLPKIVAETPVGKIVKIELISNGKKKVIDLKLEAFPTVSHQKNDAIKKDNINIFSGMNVASITPELRNKYRLATNINGLVITSLSRHSKAARSGLRAGDVVVAVNQHKVTTPEDLKKNIDGAKSKKAKSVMLWVNRSGVDIFMQLGIN